MRLRMNYLHAACLKILKERVNLGYFNTPQECHDKINEYINDVNCLKELKGNLEHYNMNEKVFVKTLDEKIKN